VKEVFMRKQMGGAAMVAAASFLAFSLLPSEKEETVPKVSLQVNEKPVLKDVEAEPSTNQVPVTLIEPLDGDTLKVRLNGKIETVRYLLIDTPESKNPRTCVQLYAKEANLRNSELVKSGSLTLEYEQGNIRDSYGRLLAYVFVDGESVQGSLLKEGYARVAYIIHPPYKYLDQFQEDERLAKRAKINIWSRGDFVGNWGFSGCVD
jgi:micrococcal nuclease